MIGGSPEPEKVIPADAVLGKSACYLIPDDTNTYWLSIDKPNGVLRYGVGYTNVANTLLKATLKKKENGALVWNDLQYAWLDGLADIRVIKGGIDQVSDKTIHLQNYPFNDTLESSAGHYTSSTHSIRSYAIHHERSKNHAQRPGRRDIYC